jgi:hypothetical protein
LVFFDAKIVYLGEEEGAKRERERERERGYRGLSQLWQRPLYRQASGGRRLWGCLQTKWNRTNYHMLFFKIIITKPE